jgi:hypothetical protein
MLVVFGLWVGDSSSPTSTAAEPNSVATALTEEASSRRVASLDVVPSDRVPVTDAGREITSGLSGSSNEELTLRAPEWLSVSHLFSSDFMLTDEDKQEFLQDVLTVREDVPFNEGTVSITIDLAKWDREQRMGLLADLGVSQDRYEEISHDVEQLRVQCFESIEPFAESAVDLLGDSLREYWKNDMYFRGLVGDPAGVPEGFWQREKGVYGTKFASEARGWKIRVSFDSADFPMLESTLVEVERLKNEFTSSLLSLLADK